MTVIKKDGRIQDFDIEKMCLSIGYAFDDAKAPMTASDINLVVKEVMAAIESLETQLNTATIRELIIGSLIKFGFTYVAKHYSEN